MTTKIYDHSFNVLKSVLKDHVTFSLAVKNGSKGSTKEEFAAISSLCGIFLRNYFAVKAISEIVFKTKQEEPVIYIGLVYVNDLFKKIVDEKESLTYLVSKLGLYQVKFDDEIKENFKKALADKNNFIKSAIKNNQLDNGSNRRYLSCVTNLPEWVIKMLNTQYGRDYALDVIHSLFKMPKQYAVKNLVLGDVDDSTISNFFVKVSDNFYEYKSKTSIRKDTSIRESKFLPIQKGEYEMVQNLPELEGKCVTFYFEEKNSIYVALLNKYLTANNKVSLASNNPKLNPDLYSKIKPLKKTNLDIYESTETELIAHLSEKQDLFILLPKSSNLELLRRTPEYGIIFDSHTLDELIKNQMDELLDATQYVAEGGKLVYCVPTFDIKETMVTINKFLNARKDFALIKETMYFPYEKENTLFYYAILEKKANN